MRRRAVIPARRGPGLVNTVATTAVVVGTAKTVSGAMDKSAQQKAATQQQAVAQQQQMADLQAQQAALAAQQQALAQQQAAPADDSLDSQLVQIQKLSALKDQGVLTEEEFQAKKRQILGI